MSRLVALQMDPIHLLNPRTDTTLLLGREAQRRGWTLVTYTPQALGCEQGRMVARVQELELRDGEADFYTLGVAYPLDLAQADYVLLRQDPPFDMTYITTTYLLERLAPRVKVFNNPAAVRNYPEKLFPLEFQEFMPPTLISADARALRAFHAEHRDIVLKPLYGYGGRAVFRVPESGANLEALVELLLTQSPVPLVAQRFLPEVKTEDRRMIVIGGEIKGIMGRIPAAGEIRANFRTGGREAAVSLTPRQRACGEAVGRVLKEQGIILAGLDFIGDFLTEINITSPTGLRQMNALYGLHLERDFWDAALA